MIIIVGRGHSGTRAIAHTLLGSGVHMGEVLNVSGDLIPPDPMYQACVHFGRHVKYKSDLEWDFSGVLSREPTEDFVTNLNRYLNTVLRHKKEKRGWKIPETSLVYPWVVRMFPEAKYIYWVRDPRDNILAGHGTDLLSNYAVPCEPLKGLITRAASWKYQWDLFKAVPEPKNLIKVRFEDFVLKQEETLKRLEEFLGFPLARIVVNPAKVERWRTTQEKCHFEIFRNMIEEFGYPPLEE